MPTDLYHDRFAAEKKKVKTNQIVLLPHTIFQPPPLQEKQQKHPENFQIHQIHQIF